ncbi:hypothetical protein JCM5350_003679 [Sporobolomyces pararoseus]
MSSSHKRHHDSNDGGEGDEEPWWERDRRGDDNLNSSRTQFNSRRYDDRERYGNSSRGSYNNRGRGFSRGGYGNDNRRPRDDYNHSSHSRGYPLQPQQLPYGYNGYGGAALPHAGRHAEDGEIMLNYSDTPSVPIPTGPRHASPRSSNQSTLRSEPSRPSSINAPLSDRAESTAQPTIVEDTTPINLEVAEEPDPEQVLAERRRKRAEILAKYASKQPPSTDTDNSAPATDSTGAGQAANAEKREPEEEKSVSTPGRNEVERATKRLKLGTDSPAVSAAPTTSTSTAEPSRATSVDPANSNFTLLKDENEENSDRKSENENDKLGVHKSEVTGEEEPEISAADYNPDFDRREDEKRMERLAATNGGNAGAKGKEDLVLEEEEESGEEEEEEDDDDDDDMFAIGTEDAKPKKKKRKTKKSGAVPVVNRTSDAAALNPSLLADNFDDSEGYYKVILGEVLDGGRYLVQANLGKGMFSSVVKAKDLGEDGKGIYKPEDGEKREVAIKMVRSQESMFKAGLKEAQILRKLMDADPDDKKHLIRLLRTFEHRGHLCLVFESLSMNLREVVKRYGKDVGLNLRAVRAYASQMFLALALMKKCDLMHADLKPDNILVNESKSTLKVCDLGSASDVTENEITPYLVSRFYRAPEIILGLPYDCSLDVWSIGCTLYELYTGKILFPGRTNNHMLLLMMETKGKFQNKLIKKARFGDQHFDDNMNFLSHEKNDVITPRQIPAKPPSDLRSRLMPSGVTRKMKDDEVRLLTNFVDLLDKMLNLEPSKRPLPKDLLAHPFIRG